MTKFPDTYTSGRAAKYPASTALTSINSRRWRSVSAIGFPSDVGYSITPGSAAPTVSIARPPRQSASAPASFFHFWRFRYKVRSPIPSSRAASSRFPAVSSSAFSM